MQTEIHPLILNNLLFSSFRMLQELSDKKTLRDETTAQLKVHWQIPRVLIQFLEPKYDHDVWVSIVTSAITSNMKRHPSPYQDRNLFFVAKGMTSSTTNWWNRS